MTLAPNEEYCTSCGEPVKKAAEWCPNCGVGTSSTPTASQQTHRYCESCGEQISVNAEICPECGVRQQPTAPPSPESTGSQADIESSNGSSSNSSNFWYYVQWAVGVLFLFSAIAGLSDVSEDGILLTVTTSGFLALLGLVLIPAVRNNVEKQHPIATNGTVQSVRTEEVRNPTELCSKCYGDIETGVRKEFGSNFVVAGLTLSRNIDGENYYCQECRKLEEGAIDTDGFDDTTQSVS